MFCKELGYRGILCLELPYDSGWAISARTDLDGLEPYTLQDLPLLNLLQQQ